MNKMLIILWVLVAACGTGFSQPRVDSHHNKEFLVASPGHVPVIYFSTQEPPVVGIAAHALAGDIEKMTGITPVVTSDTGKVSGRVIVLGTLSHSDVVRNLIGQDHLADLKGKWEHFLIRVVNHKVGSSEAGILLIAGSDARGAAYGAFTLSGCWGVSPWEWWADVRPPKKKRLTVPEDINIRQGPSVRYRGIFLNDEDWGLRPWASKTYEPGLGNIGPKTYARIFELLLRLKANTIWPAMHPGTTPFFKVAGNEQMASRYSIVVGTSHAEPMMRNNVGEWDPKRMGAFNYITNRDSVFDYWQRRVKQVAHDENIYTIGMRGVHDSRMEGAGTVSEAARVLQQVFGDQRGLLRKYVNPDLDKVPQAFIPYKEVLPVYDAGLKVPDDVTLIWPDDNYGYIRRLSDPSEQLRPGSSGVYYHLSYWGRPHDYLWLSTTQPGLIWEEMHKAWDYGARRIWIANVGDIKPAAYNIEFFLDLAWNIHSIAPDSLTAHMQRWAAREFGAGNRDAVTRIMTEFYRLAFIRRPAFMGWSQTEPTTPTRNSDFSAFLNGDEIARRVEAYQDLVNRVKQLSRVIPPNRQAAFFELVAYPVKGAAYMNEKFLYAQKSRLFARYGLPVANAYARLSRAAYDSIKAITLVYNLGILGGKWNHMMSMAPRDLPVFQMPELPDPVIPGRAGIKLWLEGQSAPLEDSASQALPRFNPYTAPSHFIALFNQGERPASWRVVKRDAWIRPGRMHGVVDSEYKLQVSIDWKAVPRGCLQGAVSIRAMDRVYTVSVPLAPAIMGSGAPGSGSLVECDGHVYIQANDYYKKYDHSRTHCWTVVGGLGFSDHACTILPIPAVADTATDSSWLAYRFYTFSKGPAEIRIFTLPTQPVAKDGDVRLGVSIDGGALRAKSFRTPGRSDVWKQQVLRNQAITVFHHDFRRAGWHTMRLYALDPGVVVDQAAVDFRPDPHFYTIPVKK